MYNNEYLEDYFLEAETEMNNFIINGRENKIDDPLNRNIFIEAKEGVYKDNYVVRDNLQIPFVSSNLAKRRVQDTIIEFTGSFMDEHSKELGTSGPVYMFQFGAKEVQPLYDLFGVDADKCIEIYNKMNEETYYGKISKFITGWVKNAPHKILLTSILIDALQNNYEDIVTCCEYLWAFSEYPIMYRDYWKIGVKEDVMNYTIEHLSLKYKVRQLDNLQELLKYDAHSAVENKSDELKKGADNSYIDFMRRMRNQINSKFKNISRAYYNNIANNASQHNQESEFEDGTKVDQDGHSSNISTIVNMTINKYATNGSNNALLKIAADGSKVDKDTLSNFINQINSTKGNRINKFIENVITIYFVKNPNNISVGSGTFINFGLSLYKSISTSKDPLYQEVREILNFWMNEIINIRNIYQSESTIISYTRAIFNYLILMIHYYN